MIKEYFVNYYQNNSQIEISLKNQQARVLTQNSEPWKITLVDTGLETLTAGRILKVRDYIGDEPFMLTYGDGVSNVDIGKLLQFHREQGKIVSISTTQPDRQMAAYKLCPSGKDNLCGHRFDKQHGELPLGYDRKYVYSHFGYNLKATDLQAAIGCAQLKKLPEFTERRRENFARLKNRLLEAENKLILPEACPDSNPSWFGFVITCRDGVDKNQVVSYLEQNGVQTRMLFSGNLIKQPCFDEMRKRKQGYRAPVSLEVTDAVMERSFWVGVYPGMTEKMIDYMAQKMIEIVGK